LGSGFQHSFKTLAPEECLVIGIAAKEIPEHLFGILGSTTLEDLVTIIGSDLGIEEPFLLETGLEHVEAKDFTPLKRSGRINIFPTKTKNIKSIHT